MKIIPIITETWKMDGGVAFGVVPKSIWHKLYPADENNLLTIVNRCLLIETDNRLIVVNAGYGNKRNEKYYSYKYIIHTESLTSILKTYGYSCEDVSDVILTHLHDDHCGGATYRDENSGLVHPLFLKADYWISATQWKWALYPNARESASYFPDNLLPLENTGRLHLIVANEKDFEKDGIRFQISDGHTRGQLIIHADSGNKTFVYMSDFIASSAHLPLPYIPSVDIEPLKSLAEKEEFLKQAAEKKYILIFEHDYYTEACTIGKNEKGYFAEKRGKLSEFIQPEK